MKSFTVTEIAAVVGADLQGDGRKEITGPAPFEQAGGDQITFAAQAKFLKRIPSCRAGAVLVPAAFAGSEARCNLLRVKNPTAAFARVVGLFHPGEKPSRGISAGACVGRRFRCGTDPSIGHGVVISDEVVMGDRVTVHPHVFIGQRVVIGDDVEIHPNVTILADCRIGNRVIIQAGTVIGSDGFGYAPEGEAYLKIPHTGIVRIDDDVEIGAGNTIDRATMGQTWIKRGVKTDNLVHIAHNVTIGEDTLLVAQVGIAGSTTIGHHSVLAGQVGVSGHLTIGSHVTIGPQAGVAKSIEDGQIVSGSPQMPHRQWLRVQGTLPGLPELKRKLGDLEKRLERLTGGMGAESRPFRDELQGKEE
ncbi:MAG: UDP-3-O-(3-hydroxymyristoyl)glucosamine N-acyltransferase [Thermodesulfobacteriota bacterium]